MSTVRDDLGWMDRSMCVAIGATRWESWLPLQRWRVCHGCPVREQCREWMDHDPKTAAAGSTPAVSLSAGTAR